MQEFLEKMCRKPRVFPLHGSSNYAPEKGASSLPRKFIQVR